MGAGLEHDDNIPLRITLRLLDEVFDLADRNIWLRRQMIIVLRQIVKTMFGDTVNKKIVDYFASLTSVDAVSGYLNNIKVSDFQSKFNDHKERTLLSQLFLSYTSYQSHFTCRNNL